jgi:hypothetical protein
MSTEISDEAYSGLLANNRLRELVSLWKSAKTDREKAFIEGRMLEATVDLEEHPEWFGHGCLCALCRSYD